MSTQLCEICGNEIVYAGSSCPFCGAELLKSGQLPQGPKHKIVNLKKGMPLVREALEKMKQELQLAGKQRCLVITFIHGYRASGKGGAIRDEVRRQLNYMREQGQIKEMAAGENLGKNSGQRRQLFKRFSFLEKSGEYHGPNPGITLVVL